MSKSFPAPAPRRFAWKAADVNRQANMAVLEDLNLEIAVGEFVVFLGPSGCGKTTLLKLIGGFTEPDSGSILINGEAITGPNHLTMTVFQNFALFPWRTVLQNVELPMEGGIWEIQDRAERRARAAAALEKVGLSSRLHAHPPELSGGMQQRLALARGLVVQPAVLLMDEAFGSLDLKTREEMQQVLLRVWQETQQMQTIIFVTHDIQEAIVLADRIVVLSGSPAKIAWNVEMRKDRLRNREYVTSREGLEMQKEIVRKLYGAQDRAVVRGRAIQHIPTSVAQ